MAEHVWSILCASSIIDRETQAVSLLNIVEVLTITEPAAMLKQALETKAAFQVQMELWSQWVRSDYATPETAMMRCSLVAPDEHFPPQPFPVSLEETTTAHTKLRVSLFPFRGAGVYVWIVEKRVGDLNNWEVVAQVPFEMTVNLEESPIPSPSAPEPLSAPTPAAPPGSSSQPGPSRPSRRRASQAPRQRGSS
jgi:hypothetical protein